MLNRYSLSYQEQLQLFRFDQDYFSEFLTRPGGLLSYLNTFIVQFFISPLAAATIVTFSGYLVFRLSGSLLKTYRITEKLWPYLLTLILFALESDYTYSFSNTVGFICALSFTLIYVRLSSKEVRYISGFILIILLNALAGSFSIIAVSLCIIHELLYWKDHYRFPVAAAYLIIPFLIPYIYWHIYSHVPLLNSILAPLILPGNLYPRNFLIALFSLLPVLLILFRTIPYYYIESWNNKKRRYQLIVLKWLVIAVSIILMLKYSYSPKNELVLKMDNYVQHQKWQDVTELSSKFSKPDRVISHFTNIALYKSGKLGDQLFRYHPPDQSFLWLSYPEIQFPYFFGFDIFYHLGYINKAYAWAYDAMIGSGPSPRLIKQLFLGSLINGNLPLAEKYLRYLDESLFYRKWAAQYRNYLIHPELINNDQEIMGKRRLTIHSDFNGDTSLPDSILVHLLQNHPENKMAFEYYMSTLLLEKNISEFTYFVSDLNKYNYKAIPLHFEEALLLNMYYTNKNVIPAGYVLRQSSARRFDAFMKLFSSSSSLSQRTVDKLSQEFGDTYWYYFYFLNKNANVQ